MPLNLASPGLVVREVDLTIGRVDTATTKSAGIVAPFQKGPVNEPITIEDEQGLIDTFGEPLDVDKHYEYWLTASSYLSYGGILSVVRSDDNDLKNATDDGSPEIKILSTEDYNNKGYDLNALSNTVVAARNPGSWANDLKVCIIDGKADQILSGINTAGVSNFTAAVSNRTGTVGVTTNKITGITTTSIVVGQEIQGDISGVVAAGATVSSISAAASGTIVMSLDSVNTAQVTTTFDFGVTSTSASPLAVGMGLTQTMVGKVIAGAGSTAVADGFLKGMITEIGVGSIGVKVLEHTTAAGVTTTQDYTPNGIYAFTASGSVGFTTAGQTAPHGTGSYTARADWFDTQSISLSNSTIKWNNLAERPGTSAYASARSSRFDEVHVVIIDDKGSVTGNAGTVLEKHVGLSKASDAEFSAGSPSYWRKYLYTNSDNIFGMGAPAGITTTSFNFGTFATSADTGWDQAAQGIAFGGSGVTTLTLQGCKNYGGETTLTTAGAMKASLGGITSGYDLFEDKDQFDIDFLLMGSGNYPEYEAQAIANKIISVAELRKDVVAFISPYRGAFLNDSAVGQGTINSSADITNNVTGFYAPITSSTYAVFDSGYKYMFDRFTDTFRYVPLNGDIAGTCARNDINNFPWFSPAGTARGGILNAVKLAYTPNQTQRDILYSNRINPVIFSPGAGIILFGDKTGFGKASAFDRINVRRLFIFIEEAISAAAKDQLFEFNDEITRTNFVNIVEPFLRDVQSKRGIFDFRVVCDETNNTAAIIDNNEFIADIFIKPSRSINFIGLTFVATRTGISFDEVIGTV